MRFAGPICTAIAAVGSMAALSRGDDLQTLNQVPKAQPTAATAPPADTQGTWVSDANVRTAQTATPTSARRAYMPPLPMNPGYPQRPMPMPMNAAYPQSMPMGAPNPQQPGGIGQPGMGGPMMGGPGMQAGMQMPMNGPPGMQTGMQMPMNGPGGPMGGMGGPGGQMMMPPGQGYGPPPGQGYGPPPGQGSFAGGPPQEGCPPDGPADDEECENKPGWFGGPDCVGLWAQTHIPQKFFVRTEYLAYQTKGNPLPSLVTTSFPGTPQTQAGVLGLASTSTLFGNEKVDQSLRSGGRLTIGFWFDEGQFNGIEGHYFALGAAGTNYSNAQSFTNNPNATILARPFFNTQTGAQDSSVLAFPNFNLLGTTVQLNGTVNAQSVANLQSAGLLFRHLMWVDFEGGYRMDLLTGYRFFKADNSISISDSTSTVGGLLAPTTFTAYDSFAARNTFNGGEIGFSTDYYWGRLSLNSVLKSAFGVVHEVVKINGNSTVTTLGTTATTVGGLLAQPTNIGQYGQSKFAALPEVALTLRYDISCSWRLTAGYNFMYLTRMQNSGSAIDTTVNPTQIGGTGVTAGTPARPAFAFSDTGFFAQGVSSGLEYRW